jgi:hypothetical protein
MGKKLLSATANAIPNGGHLTVKITTMTACANRMLNVRSAREKGIE